MALTMDGLRKLVDAEGLRYFLAPDRPALMLGVAGLNGRYQLMILLEMEGQFVQFRSVAYRHCTSGHAHLPEILKVLGELNYKLRLVKFGWDPRDGEIVVYADAWIMDGNLTQTQFRVLIQTYFSAIDLHYSRIEATIQTGKDPGPADLMATAEARVGSGLPPEMRKAIEELLKRVKEGGPEGTKKDEEAVEPVEKL